MTDLVSPTDIDVYRTDGVVVVRGLADEEWCDRLAPSPTGDRHPLDR